MGNHFNVPKIRSQGRVNWCGPYALAVIFGCSYDHAESFVRQVTKSKRIQGLWNSEMKLAITARNNTLTKSRLFFVRHETTAYYATGYTGRSKRMTLTQWYKQRPNKTATYIVNVTGHYVVVRGTKIIDNVSRVWQPVHVRRQNKRSLVRSVWEIQRVAA